MRKCIGIAILIYVLLWDFYPENNCIVYMKLVLAVIITI